MPHFPRTIETLQHKARRKYCHEKHMFIPSHIHVLGYTGHMEITTGVGKGITCRHYYCVHFGMMIMHTGYYELLVM